MIGFGKPVFGQVLHHYLILRSSIAKVLRKRFFQLLFSGAVSSTLYGTRGLPYKN
jgi:hypothetical protein